MQRFTLSINHAIFDIMRAKRNPRWALVLSGGGARGIAHAGFIAGLEAMGAPTPSLIVGTSMGAIVGGLYACGKTGAELKRFAVEEFDIRRYLDGFAFPKQSGTFARVLRTGQALGNLATKPGMDSGRKILALLRELTADVEFSQTRIPFRCNTVDLVTGEERVLSSGSVARAMLASMSFPAFFDPLVEGDARLVDGGIVNNLPVRVARELGFRRTLAVDIGAFRPVTAASLKNGPLVIYRALEVAISHIERGDADRATLTINVNDGSSAFDFARAKGLVALGERAVADNERELKTFFTPGPLAALGRVLSRREHRG